MGGTSDLPALSDMTFQVDDDGVALLTLDRADKRVNSLAPRLMTELGLVIDVCEADPSIVGMVIASAKPDSFVVGADIDFLATLDTEQAGSEAITAGLALLARLESLAGRKPVIAAIHGPCLGGGLELTLACTSRITSDDESTTQLGQPEIKLGLMPGAGATQRLPQLVGIATALDLILTGRSLRPRKARGVGLVDEICPAEVLVEVAKRRVRERVEGRATAPSASGRVRSWLTPAHLQQLALEENPLGRKVLFTKAEERMLAETKGHYPAAPAALRAVQVGIDEGPEAGYAEETRQFVALLNSPESHALRSIFTATQELKRERGVGKGTEARRVGTVAVIGGGLMGAGIASVTAIRTSATTRIKELDHARVGTALAHVSSEVRLAQRKRRLTKGGAAEAMNRVAGVVDLDHLGQPDLVIEAVFEDLELKRRILADIERTTFEDTIFASNTSSIPIAAIAEEAARPEHVIGMHYFSPVEKMPLLELVVTDATADWVTATCVAFGKAQGKTVIVVNDAPGFYTTRVLLPYAAEFLAMVSEGVPIDLIEAAALGYGFPIGPATLSDEVGIDVLAKIAPVVAPLLGDRAPDEKAVLTMLDDGRLGRKSGGGFYRYEAGKKEEIDPTVYDLLGVTPSRPIDPARITERLVLSFVNEAARCLEEEVLRSARDGDVGAIMGVGWPPYTGGPFWYADQLGAAAIVDRLEALAVDHGPRFEPAPILREHAASGRSFRS